MWATVLYEIMRIGIDLRLPAYQMGGISQYALHLLPALAQLDFEQHVQFIVAKSRKDARDLTPSSPHFVQKVAWTPCHHPYERWALAAEITRFNVDVWHSPDFIPPAFGAKRRVITVHDLNFLYYPHYLNAESKRYYNDQIVWAVRTANMIAADSEHTRQDLINRLRVPADKVKTVYLAANPLYERAYSDSDIKQTLSQYDLSSGFILFVGTIEPRKNVAHLVRTYNMLRQEGQIDESVPLVLVGRKGWLADNVFALIDAFGLSGHVRHLTGVHDEALAHLYHAAGLLVLPSHYEGFGLPPLEAMWCGCPIVTSNRGSLPEIVGDAGYLLDADDVDVWAETIVQVLSDSALRTQLITKGYDQAAKFSWKHTAEQTFGLYKNSNQ